MADDKRIYLIGLTLIKGVGCISARHLLQYFGNAEAIFTEKRQALEKAPGIGEYMASKIIEQRTEALKRAEEEISFIEKTKSTCIRLSMITIQPVYANAPMLLWYFITKEMPI